MTLVLTNLTDLPFQPERAAYNHDRRTSVKSVELDGGMSRTRADVIGQTAFVTAEWVLDAEEYEYFTFFYQFAALEGAISFVLALVLDKPDLEDFNCKFVPGSVQMTNPNGTSFFVSAELEVEPIIEVSSAFSTFVKARYPATAEAWFNDLAVKTGTDYYVP